MSHFSETHRTRDDRVCLLGNGDFFSNRTISACCVRNILSILKKGAAARYLCACARVFVSQGRPIAWCSKKYHTSEHERNSTFEKDTPKGLLNLSVLVLVLCGGKEKGLIMGEKIQ